MRVGLSLFFAAVLAAAQLPAQTISGRVYDSVAKAPLAGARVQLVTSPVGTAPARDVTTDGDGKYTFNDVASGRYVLGFYGAVLDSIGIEPPFVRIEMRRAPLLVDLSVPSPAQISTAICGARVGKKDQTGVLVGHLYDAATRQGVAGATVVAEWHSVGLVKGIINVSNPEAIVTTAASGWFAFCGVPRDDDVVLAAIRGGDTTGMTTVHVPADGLGRRELYVDKTEIVTVAARDSVGVADSTRPPEVVHRGHGRLSGTVIDANNHRPLAGAQVMVAGAGLSQVTNDRGTFSISGAPGGTQTVVVRAVGYAPVQRGVDLMGDEPLSLDVAMTTFRSILDTMRITASRVYSRDANGFERRRKTTFGKFFDSTDVGRIQPSQTTRLVESVGGVRMWGSGLNQRIFMGTLARCEPTIFVDGVTFPDFTAADLNTMVPPEDILGLEVYTSATAAPAQFKGLSSLSRSGRGCGSIVVWTKRNR